MTAHAGAAPAQAGSRGVLPGLRVAVVHDWLVTYAGAERVLEGILELLPQAELYSLVDFLPEAQRGFIHHKPVHTSFIQGLPLARRHYRHFLPLMPLAVEQFDLSSYDLVLSSSYAVAKGVITGPDQLHLSYVHSPARYAWDLQHQYLRESGLERGVKGALARVLLHRLRLWDARTANGVDGFMANSRFIARRIWKIYRREATVIHPPVNVRDFALRRDKEDFYLTASRLVPYKKIDLIARAFAGLPDKRLVVIGEGPELTRVRAAAGPNVTLLGYQPFEVLRDHMQRARAFVFAAEEDFGIVPVEAQACGTPVIAYGKGGVLETVRDGVTGLLFHAQTVAALQDAVARFEAARQDFRPEAIREHAGGFAEERFRDKLAAYLESSYASWQRERDGAG